MSGFDRKYGVREIGFEMIPFTKCAYGIPPPIFSGGKQAQRDTRLASHRVENAELCLFFIHRDF